MYPELSGQYVLGKTIGTGGFGKVKVATHMATGEKVAIKIMNKKYLVEDMPRVYQEIEALKSLSHPHICQLYQVVESATHVFLIMEYCSGGELFDYIIQKERLEVDEARQFFRQIVAAVAYCHRMGYAHRDLKPENILLDSEQNLKIVDFGLCVRPMKGTQLLTSCGSPNYAAPELLRGLKYFGPQIDIWSLGVLLYAVLCGNLPFEADTSDKLYAKILNGMYEEPEWLSKESKMLISSLLQIDPALRLTTEQLCEHPWLNDGFNIKVNDLSVGVQVMRYDGDCLRVIGSYLKLTPAEAWQQIQTRKIYDYTMATYRILLHRKKNRLPLRRLRRPPEQSIPEAVVSIKSPETVNDATYVVMRRTYLLESNKVPSPSSEGKENVIGGTMGTPQATPLRLARRSAPIGARRASKRIRSPGLGDREPVPKKMVTSLTRTPVSTPQPPSTPLHCVKTPSSARRVLNGIERSIRQVLTPRRSLPRNASAGKPAVLGTKNMVNVTSTNSTNPGHVMTLLKAALEEKGIPCTSHGFTICGKVRRAGIGNQQQKVSFELEVCWISPAIANSDQNSLVVGIRRKRLKGDAWIYKCVCEEVLAIASA